MSLDNMLKKLSVRSPWLFRINAGSCNGCDVELATRPASPATTWNAWGAGTAAAPAMPTSCSSPAR